MNETSGLFVSPALRIPAALGVFLALTLLSAFIQAAAPPKAAADQDPKAAEELLELFRSEENITNSLGSVFVWVKQGYRVGQHEVTQAEYESVTGNNPSRFPGPRQPVEQVTWTQANEFCALLTRREQEEGKLPKEFQYALPSESQWEYYVDNTPLDQAIVSLIGDRPKPFPVGSLPANDLGLQDVRGNVWEWCSTPVARGASYMSHGDYLMISFRYTATPTDSLEDVGFRCILVEKK